MATGWSMAGTALFSSLLLVTPANAQDVAPANYAAPTIPAATFVGATPSSITRPVTPKDFATTLVNGFDSGGRVVQGLAVAVTPWFLIPGTRIGLTEYQTHWPQYFLSRAQISIATARVSTDTAETDVALGVHFTVFDKSDPMRDHWFTDSLSLAMDQCAPALPGASALPCLDSTTAARSKAYAGAHWNESSLSIAWAGGWRLADSRASQRQWRGFSTWVSGSVRMTSKGSGILQVQLDQHDGSRPCRPGARRQSAHGEPNAQCFSERSREVVHQQRGTEPFWQLVMGS
jgi:hypothetical protein